jgi:hypothetical protein
MASTKKKSKRPAATEADLEAEIAKLGLVHLPVPSDGNCFYHSILAHFRMSRVPGLEDETIESLRHRNVEYMLANIYDIVPFVIEKESNTVNGVVNEDRKLARVRNDIERMRADGVWASEIGDMISINTAKNLNIKIIIHDWKWDDGHFDTIVINPSNANNARNESHTTVHLLRINDGHYELLYPVDEFTGYAKSRWAEESARMAYDDAEFTFENYIKGKKPTKASLNSYLQLLERRLDIIETSEEDLNSININNNINTNNMRIVVDDYKQAVLGFIDNIRTSIASKERNVRKTRKMKSPTRNELKGIAKSMGINIPKGTRKNVIRSMIESVSADNNVSSNSSVTSRLNNVRPPTPPLPSVRRSARIKHAKSTVSSSTRRNTNKNKNKNKKSEDENPILKRAKNLNLINKNARANSVNINALRNLLESMNLGNNK